MTTTRRSDVWELDDDPSWLTTAQGGWQSLVTSSGTASATTASVRERVAGAWEGTYAENYLAYAPDVTAGMDELREMAAQVRTTLGSIHDVISGLRADLNSSYARASTDMTSVWRSGGTVTFEYPETRTARRSTASMRAPVSSSRRPARRSGGTRPRSTGWRRRPTPSR